MNPTKAQQEAIVSDAENILVIAGAGSGKTATVTKRIERLINEGANPGSILCLTFTRKAAKELKERIGRLIGEQKAKRIWAGTFHSISYRVLMQWGSKIGYQTTEGRAITVVTPEESDLLLKEIKKAYEYKEPMKRIHEAKATLAHDGEWPKDKDLCRIIEEYNSRLKESNAVDFDSLLLEVQKLFDCCPDALAFYQKKFDHIFVDEYQDTDTVQYNLHEILKPKHLFCVGDSDQAIYGWRGANINIILNFEKDHSGAQVIKLEDCFRCGNAIVERANNLIAFNVNRIEKTLNGATRSCGVFEVEDLNAPEDIVMYIANYMAFEDPGQIAVIARNHHSLELIENACNDLELDVIRVGKETKEVEAEETFQFMLAFLRLQLNPRDNIAFLTYNKFYQQENLKDVWKSANLCGCSWFEAVRDLQNEKEINFELDGYICNFYRDCCDFIMAAPSEKVIDYLNEFFPEILVEDFIAEFSLKDNQLELEKKQHGKVILLTAHAAKGLEWDNVLLAYFDEGKFPSKQAINLDNLEEERRLAYVAFTRARKRLIAFCTKNKISRFVAESYSVDAIAVDKAA